jgi:hypothetical protein
MSGYATPCQGRNGSGLSPRLAAERVVYSVARRGDSPVAFKKAGQI